ncbi:LLM class flavin-dependent oxidoreductase [Mycobacterium paraffinicum]|nr:LLM class flavin-dependent oxidoreductase [Mycobacterium paraffinicum]
MSSGRIEIDAPFAWSRYNLRATLTDNARQYRDSGVIDSGMVWDQLTWFTPPWMWDPDSIPMARVLPDCDSFPDPFTSLAHAVGAAPGLGVTAATDTVRRSPAELFETMLTLGELSGRRATLQLGAGELKQAQPFGWKRAQGLKRMEDHLRIYEKFLSKDGPIDFEGHHWIYDQAWLGDAKRLPPRVFCLGGGPKLLEIATKYADGFATLAPGVANGGEHLQEIVTSLRGQVAEHGRDPEAFEFALFPCALLIHEDENVIDRALDHPFMRWLTATWGRINQEDWRRDGFEPPRPGWHYALDLLPVKVSKAEGEEVLGRVTRKMTEAAWIYGTPAQVAEQLQPYIDAGATWLHLGDTLPFLLDPEDAQLSANRIIEVARILKRTNVSADARSSVALNQSS